MSFYGEKETVIDTKSQKSFDSQAPVRSYGKRDQRPPVPIDPPTLTRIYRNTAQRVKLSISSLRSDAVFLLVCDEDKQVLAWFGSESSVDDREIALKIGLEIAIKDYSNVELEEIPVILEDLERSVQLRYFLDKLWEDEATYRAHAAREHRKNIVINLPVTLYVLEKIIGGNYLMKEIKRAIPDENGTVHRIAFAPIEKDSIIAISYGELWDLWVARGSLQDQENIQTFLANYISNQSELSSSGWGGSDHSQNIRVIKQGCERRLFRLPFKLLTNFEPAGKTIPYSVYSAYDMSADKNKGTHIEDSTENSEYDENGEYYDDEGYYDEYGDEEYYDDEYNDGFYDDGYGENENYPEDTQNQNVEVNSSFTGSSFYSNSNKERKVTFDDGFSVQDGALTEPNPMAANFAASTRMPSSPPSPVRSYQNQIFDDITPPSILTEARDRRKNLGKYMLTQESLTFREEENVGPEVRMELLEQSIKDPKILVGWQV